MDDYIGRLDKERIFDKTDIAQEIQKTHPSASRTTVYRILRRLLECGQLVRAGRNAYYVPSHKLPPYRHEYSALSGGLAAYIIQSHPLLGFRIYETVQLNEFVNHQIGKNIVFLSVEDGLGDFLFPDLREKYSNNVLLDPSAEMFHQYWSEGMVVITKLPTEAPKGRDAFWHTCLEKMLVDILTDRLLMDSLSETEYPAVYENAFSHFAIDEGRMFRYARRRGADEKIRDYIKNNTAVKLRTR